MLNHNLEGRGTWHRAWQLGRELARRGHRVSLWTAAPHHFYRPAREVREGVEIIGTPSWAPLAGADDGWGPLDVLYRLARILLEPIDLCYCFAHPPNVFLPAWVARRIRRKPLLYDWCDWYEGGIFPKRQALRRSGLAPATESLFQPLAERGEVALERRMARLAGRVSVISRRLRELSLEAGRRPEELLLLPNGADLDGIRPLDAAACRAELGLPPDGLYLGYVANYHPDQELLLRAFAQACRAVPKLKMIATGPPFSEDLMRGLELGGRVIGLGSVPSSLIPPILGAADALALPLEDNASNIARVPFKFTEYLAAGRPVVACQVGDVAQWFEPQTDAPPIGIASFPQPEAYGEAIRRIMAEDSDRAAMGASARRLAEAEFSWPVLADRLETFIARWLGYCR